MFCTMRMVTEKLAKLEQDLPTVYQCSSCPLLTCEELQESWFRPDYSVLFAMISNFKVTVTV